MSGSRHIHRGRGRGERERERIISKTLNYIYFSSNLDVGSRCLVKQSDELWHEANIW